MSATDTTQFDVDLSMVCEPGDDPLVQLDSPHDIEPFQRSDASFRAE
jgi:hypothetical protein